MNLQKSGLLALLVAAFLVLSISNAKTTDFKDLNWAHAQLEEAYEQLVELRNTMETPSMGHTQMSTVKVLDGQYSHVLREMENLLSRIRNELKAAKKTRKYKLSKVSARKLSKKMKGIYYLIVNMRIFIRQSEDFELDQQSRTMFILSSYVVSSIIEQVRIKISSVNEKKGRK